MKVTHLTTFLAMALVYSAFAAALGPYAVAAEVVLQDAKLRGHIRQGHGRTDSPLVMEQ